MSDLHFDPNEKELPFPVAKEIEFDAVINLARECRGQMSLDTKSLSPAEDLLFLNLLETLRVLTTHGAREAVVLWIINKRRLYRAQYDTFEEFYLATYGHSVSHAYTVLDHAEVILILAPGGYDCFPHRLQAMELRSLKVGPDKIREIWQEAIFAQKPVDRSIFDAAIKAVLGKEALAKLQAKRAKREGSHGDEKAVTLRYSKDFVGKLDLFAQERGLTRKAYVDQALRKQVAYDEAHSCMPPH